MSAGALPHWPLRVRPLTRKRIGRPPGSLSAEPTTQIRVPVWLLDAYREKHGPGWSERLREYMRRDVQGDLAATPMADARCPRCGEPCEDCAKRPAPARRRRRDVF
jgi:hypothetical protein